jgi:hypothetical protein
VVGLAGGWDEAVRKGVEGVHCAVPRVRLVVLVAHDLDVVVPLAEHPDAGEALDEVAPAQVNLGGAVHLRHEGREAGQEARVRVLVGVCLFVCVCVCVCARVCVWEGGVLFFCLLACFFVCVGCAVLSKQSVCIDWCAGGKWRSGLEAWWVWVMHGAP